MTPPKLIYFMKPVGCAGPIKIGCSRFTGQRLIDLSMWSPVPLEIMAQGEGSHSLEHCIHRIYAPFRSHGEWFFANPDLLTRIKRVGAGEDVAAVFEASPVHSRKWVGAARRHKSPLDRAARRPAPRPTKEAAE